MNLFFRKSMPFVPVIIIIVFIACNSDKRNIPLENQEKKDSTEKTDTAIAFPGYYTLEIFTPELIKLALKIDNEFSVRTEEEIRNTDFRISSSIAEFKDGYYRTIKLFIRSAKPEDTKSNFKKAEVSAKDLTDEPIVIIDNLGDRAYWAGGSFLQMNVLKNNSWIIITMRQRDKTKKEQKIMMEDSRKIAELVLKKM